MILFDVNPLVYAHRAELPEHARCAALLVEAAEGVEPFALTSAVVAGFLRVVTHPKVFNDPTPVHDALRFVEELQASPACRIAEPGDRWWAIFAELCRTVGARGNLVPDAHLAAVAIEHGYELITADHGFARFPRLRWRDPLAQR